MKKNTCGEFSPFYSYYLFISFCDIRNIFKMVIIKLYSPMIRSLTEYLLNPKYLIYIFGVKSDFIKQGERNIPCFVMNLIISFIISFFDCVYNEFIVLFFMV